MIRAWSRASSLPVSPSPSAGSQASYIPTLHAGTLQAQLVASDGAAGDNFGSSVDIDGDTIVVGAPGDDIGANVDQGSAYVFVRVGRRVDPAGEARRAGRCDADSFGASVSVSGNTVLIGAPSRNVSPSQFAGGVRIRAHWRHVDPSADSDAMRRCLLPRGCQRRARWGSDAHRRPGACPVWRRAYLRARGRRWTLQATLLGRSPRPGSRSSRPRRTNSAGASGSLAIGRWSEARTLLLMSTSAVT